MFFACRVRLVFRDKSERTATKDHGGVAAIALCPDTLRGSCSGRESAIKLFQTAVSCRPSRHSPCCERLLTLPLLSMSWSILLKVWPLFRCSCMAAFGCSLRRCVGSGADGAHQRHARLGKKYGDTAPQVFQPELCTKGKGGSSRRDT